MRLIASLLLAVLELATALNAATRPHYGGTLRVELQGRIADPNPRETGASFGGPSASSRIVPLVFEGLIRLDEDGRAHPALALSWVSDGARREWQFALRPGVTFHDGTPLTSAATAESLRSLGTGRVASASGNSVVIRCERQCAVLPQELALNRNVIARELAGGGLAGTGAFRLEAVETGKRVRLAANEQYWDGRPFLDELIFESAGSGREQLAQIGLGRAGAVEISPADLRRATQREARVWASRPRIVIGLEIRSQAVAGDAALRNALASAIDRSAIHNVLLGRQGVISGALLPDWMSGYAWLFDAPEGARASGKPTRGLTVGAETGDPLLRSIANRIVLDLRSAGIEASFAAAGRPDMQVTRLTLPSADPATALRELAGVLGGGNLPPALHAAERALLERGRFVPLFHVPVLWAVAPQVRGFEGRFEDVWIEASR